MKLRLFAILAGFVVGTLPGTGAAQVVPDLPPSGTRSGPASIVPATFGTTPTSYQRIGVTEFVPLTSSMTYSDLLFQENAYSRFPTNANGFGSFAATAHLPSGALVTAVEFDWCDHSADSDIALMVVATTYTGQITSIAGSATSTGSAGCAYSMAILTPPFQIDNNANQLILEVQIPRSDGSMSISGAIVRYQLQVSPAPAAATFSDVPTGDPGFQYVEALVASGVTGGCGAGLYCPDKPVTRRQMAIFLAKALGLQFP